MTTIHCRHRMIALRPSPITRSQQSTQGIPQRNAKKDTFSRESTIFAHTFATKSAAEPLLRYHKQVQPTGDQPARTAADKLRILQEYETYPPGSPERGARMRREGISTSQISKWRKQRDRGALDQPAPQPRGPKPTPPNPLADEVARLRAEHARVQARLDQAELVIDV